jgi:hypothetical protein
LTAAKTSRILVVSVAWVRLKMDNMVRRRIFDMEHKCIA